MSQLGQSLYLYFSLERNPSKKGNVMKLETPDKPTKEKEQISMLWDAVWNHLPHQLNFMDTKINFILAFMALLMALVGVAIFK